MLARAAFEISENLPGMNYLKSRIPFSVKMAIHRFILRCRKVTYRSRSFPNFIIIGAMKSGTTSLYSQLGQHPQLFPSYWKEVHYFDQHYAEGEAWYLAHFPYQKILGADCRTFEASPFYLFNPLVPKRLCDLLPKSKLIAILRNPTERAISHYFHERRKGRESLPIFQALLQEERRLASVIKEKAYASPIFAHCSYKRRGLYHEQLKRFLRYFPRKQILTLASEDYFRNPRVTLKRVFDFVGVDNEFRIMDLRPHNTATNRREVNSKVYDYLNEFFNPHNLALYDLVGRDFGWEGSAS